MSRLIPILALGLGLTFSAHADVWRWMDAEGITHYVDTKTPIYTWVDDFGAVHYSDTPDHEDAVSVELVWHTPGTLSDLEGAGDPNPEDHVYPGETDEDRAQREEAQAYYCKRATEVYESYLNAPQLYRTNAAGEREFLSEEETEKTIAETRAKRDEFCD